jgi:hypothetical protein
MHGRLELRMRAMAQVNDRDSEDDDRSEAGCWTSCRICEGFESP